MDALVRFSALCLDLEDLVSAIDINPLVVFEAGRGVKAVDCLVVPAQPEGSDTRRAQKGEAHDGHA